MVLVDKQGTDKQRYPFPITAAELFTTIDTFPLRKEEMVLQQEAGQNCQSWNAGALPSFWSVSPSLTTDWNLVYLFISHTPTWTHLILYTEGVNSSVYSSARTDEARFLQRPYWIKGSYRWLLLYLFLCPVYLCVLSLIFCKAEKMFYRFCMAFCKLYLSNIYIFLL